jgi:hypothetical protein
LWWDLLFGTRKGFEVCVCVFGTFIWNKKGVQRVNVCVCVGSSDLEQ